MTTSSSIEGIVKVRVGGGRIAGKGSPFDAHSHPARSFSFVDIDIIVGYQLWSSINM
jgi:hypothetical protein